MFPASSYPKSLQLFGMMLYVPRIILSKKSATFWDDALISVKQFAPDQHPSDLARAGANLIEFCVAQQAARRIIVDITIAAEKLDRVKRRACRALGRKEQGARRILA